MYKKVECLEKFSCFGKIKVRRCEDIKYGVESLKGKKRSCCLSCIKKHQENIKSCRYFLFCLLFTSLTTKLLWLIFVNFTKVARVRLNQVITKRLENPIVSRCMCWLHPDLASQIDSSLCCLA